MYTYNTHLEADRLHSKDNCFIIYLRFIFDIHVLMPLSISAGALEVLYFNFIIIIISL